MQEALPRHRRASRQPFFAVVTRLVPLDELFRLCSWNIARPLRGFPLVFVCYQHRLLFPPYEVAARIKRRSFAFLEHSLLQTLSWIVSLQLRMNVFDSAKATMRTAHQHFYVLKNAFVLVFQR
jgi:hypothetical protein